MTLLIGGRRDLLTDCDVTAEVHSDLARAGVFRGRYALLSDLNLLSLFSRLVLSKEISQLHMCFRSDDILLLLTVACKDLCSTLPLILIVLLLLLPFVVSLVTRVTSTSVGAKEKLMLFEAGTIVLLVLIVDGGHSVHSTLALVLIAARLPGLDIELYLMARLRINIFLL